MDGNGKFRLFESVNSFFFEVGGRFGQKGFYCTVILINQGAELLPSNRLGE